MVAIIALLLQTATPPPPSIDPEILDIDLLRDAFGDIGEDAIAFLNGFLDEVPGLLQEISASLASRDQAAARHAVHALKGAARSAGARRNRQSPVSPIPTAVDPMCIAIPPVRDPPQESPR